jgi:amino acid adenylation domain-containing protein
MFDLTLSLREDGQVFSGGIEYDANLFDSTTIARLAVHLKTLLRSAVSTPDREIADLVLLSPAECHELEVEGSAGGLSRLDRRVHEAIEAQVREHPESLALRFEGEWLSYGELNGRASRLAHRLSELGVDRGSRVGVCLARSSALLVSLLAVWKAGGAYVPLDPSYPVDRLLYMESDAGLSLLLVDAGTPLGLGAVVPVVRIGEGMNPGIGSDLSLEGSSSDLAYVIYTSGSTGRPKGVEVTHGSLLNFLESMREEPGLVAEDVLLAVTSLSFDIAGLELYLPLLVGGRIELLSREVASDGSRLLASLEESGATVLQATPSTWRMLIDAGWEGGSDLKVLCGGEALPERLSSSLRDRSSSVWNLYGPTETTVWSTLWRVSGSGVRIGRPIARTRAVLLDRQGRPVPLGVAGELYLGGVGVARGYTLVLI